MRRTLLYLVMWTFLIFNVVAACIAMGQFIVSAESHLLLACIVTTMVAGASWAALEPYS